jgi:hypothetical protein
LPLDIATLKVVLDMIDGTTVDGSRVLGVRIRGVEYIDSPELVGTLVGVAFEISAFGDGKLFPVSIIGVTDGIQEVESSSSVVAIEMRIVVGWNGVSTVFKHHRYHSNLLPTCWPAISRFTPQDTAL